MKIKTPTMSKDREIEEILKENYPTGLYAKLARTGDYVNTTSTVLYIFYQELQKVRADWLREEIVKLEGMKVKQEHHREVWANGEYTKMANYYMNIGTNQALQTIIDRYQSELDQPNK